MLKNHPPPIQSDRGPGRPAGRRDRAGRAVKVTARVAIASAERMKRDFARRLQLILDEKDISAAELAAAIGGSAQTVMSWTRGTSTPSLWTLVAVALALRVSLVDLMPESAHQP